MPTTKQLQTQKKALPLTQQRKQPMKGRAGITIYANGRMTITKAGAEVMGLADGDYLNITPDNPKLADKLLLQKDNNSPCKVVYNERDCSYNLHSKSVADYLAGRLGKSDRYGFLINKDTKKVSLPKATGTVYFININEPVL